MTMTTDSPTSRTSLLDVVAARTGKAPAAPRDRRTRPLTGTAQHPLVLLAGGPKVGKSYALAAASADRRVARLAVVEVGGDQGAMDAYGAIAGARAELVEHDGTWADITAAIQAECAAEPTPGGLNVLAIDGATSLWAVLSREAQRGGRDLGPGGWAAVNSTWADFLTVLRTFPGPVVLTARVDGETIVDDALGRIRTQRDLAFETDVVVQATGHRRFTLAGARSLALSDVAESGPVELGDLVLADLFELLGADEAGAE